jgi:hypothetical protein
MYSKSIIESTKSIEELQGMIADFCVKTGCRAEKAGCRAEKTECVAEKADSALSPENGGVLVVFDIDQTLIHITTPASSPLSQRIHADVFRDIVDELSPEQEHLLAHFPLCDASKIAPREVKTLDVFEALHEGGHAVIALTASFVGRIEQHSRFEVFRFEALKKLGFHFSDIYGAEARVGRQVDAEAKGSQQIHAEVGKSRQVGAEAEGNQQVGSASEELQKNSIDFEGFSTFRGHLPQYYNGMVSVNGLFGGRSKGKVLMACLNKKRNALPCGVVFVDDVETNVRDVAKVMEAAGMPCLSVLYNAALWRHDEIANEQDFKEYWEPLAARVRDAYPMANDFIPISEPAPK